MSNVITKNNSKYKRLFFTGFSMGLADLVPGVSGGTVALLYGIYDELLYSIRLVTGRVPKLLLKLKFKEAFGIIPFNFLVPLFLGIVFAIFGFVGVVTYLLENQAEYIWSLFFGLVLGSVYVVSKRVTLWDYKSYLLGIIGFGLTFWVVGLPSLNAAPTPLVLFLTGAIAICAMILPGISGSLIMVILGQYKNVINAVSERNVVDLFYFAVGAILGLAIFSRFLSWLLKYYHSATVVFLIGVMLGSLRKLWPWQIQISKGLHNNVAPPVDVTLLLSIILGFIGFVIVWKLEKLGIAKEHIDIETKDFKQQMKSQHD